MSDRWEIVHYRAFYRELAGMPPELRRRVEEIAFGEAVQHDPFLGGRVERLRGHRDCYKIRVGNYRIGLVIDQSRRVIEFRRVLHRRDIYRYFP